MATSADRDPAADSDPAHAALPCVLDIEASGFGRGSYPIEIGFVLPDGTAYCTLIVPDEGWTHWDGDAERVHGISRSLLQRHGRSAHEVAVELNHRSGRPHGLLRQLGPRLCLAGPPVRVGRRSARASGCATCAS